MYLVATNEEDFGNQRAFLLSVDWHWSKTHNYRYECIPASNPNKDIEIMQGVSIDYDKVTSILIAGNSGSGKFYTLTYLLTVLYLKDISDLYIIDPKCDVPARWAHVYGLED